MLFPVAVYHRDRAPFFLLPFFLAVFQHFCFVARGLVQSWDLHLVAISAVYYSRHARGSPWYRSRNL